MSRNKESFYSNMKSLSLYHMLGFSPCLHKISKELKRTSTTTYSLIDVLKNFQYSQENNKPEGL